MEFEYSHGRLRYANNSNYRNDSLIRKESSCFCLPFRLSLGLCREFVLMAYGRMVVWVGPLVVKELKRIIESSEITK